MEFMGNFFKLFIVFFTLKTVFNIITRTVTINNKDRQSPREGNSKALEEIAEISVKVDMVQDQICDTFLPKNKAYQLAEEDKVSYFCSWECRQKYIDQL